MNLFSRLFKKSTTPSNDLLHGVSNSVFVGRNTGNHIFHGGCRGCTMQQKEGLGYCTGCQYFEADWSLPDLNDEHQRRDKHEEGIRNIARAMANKN